MRNLVVTAVTAVVLLSFRCSNDTYDCRPGASCTGEFECTLGCFCQSGRITCEGPMDASARKDSGAALCPVASSVVSGKACTSTAPSCASHFACGTGNEATGECDCIGAAWSCTPDVPCYAGDAGVDADAGDAD